MIQAKEFTQCALEKGYRFWTGVPCSFLTPFINYVLQSKTIRYVGAASEGEAVAIAFGAHLAGRKSVVICQNSGLGNTINPLASLNHPFRIPTLLIVTHRGEPGLGDEPQHELMGAITPNLLDVLGIPWKVFPDRMEDIVHTLAEADHYMTKTGLPFALVMKKGTVAPYPLTEGPGAILSTHNQVSGTFTATQEARIKRQEAIRLIRKQFQSDALMVATTGKIGRELFALGHRANQIYVVGGMGCASGIGLGLGLCRADRKVVVLDGDGAALMKMGTLGTIGHYRPKNLIHVILDNEAHESTGGQATVSQTVDFSLVASACSYPVLLRCDTVQGLEEALQGAYEKEGPVLIHVKVAIDTHPALGRPTRTPVQIKKQFMEYITQEAVTPR